MMSSIFVIQLFLQPSQEKILLIRTVQLYAEFSLWVCEKNLHKNYPLKIKSTLVNVVEYFMKHTYLNLWFVPPSLEYAATVWGTPLEMCLICASANCFLNLSQRAMCDNSFHLAQSFKHANNMLLHHHSYCCHTISTQHGLKIFKKDIYYICTHTVYTPATLNHFYSIHKSTLWMFHIQSCTL